VSVIKFSFALISTQALDNGAIVFERDAAAAKRASAAWVSYSIKRAAQVQGINMTQAKAIIRASLSVRGNAIIVWNNSHVKTASKQRVAGCIR
jgi:hypothetical protein